MAPACGQPLACRSAGSLTHRLPKMYTGWAVKRAGSDRSDATRRALVALGAGHSTAARGRSGRAGRPRTATTSCRVGGATRTTAGGRFVLALARDGGARAWKLPAVGCGRDPSTCKLLQRANIRGVRQPPSPWPANREQECAKKRQQGRRRPCQRLK